MLTVRLVALAAHVPQTPEIWLSHAQQRLIVTVRPCDDRRVAAVRVEPQRAETRAAATPRRSRSSATLPKQMGIRFTFRATPEPFDVVVTFTDQSSCRLEQKAPDDPLASMRMTAGGKISSSRGTVSRRT